GRAAAPEAPPAGDPAADPALARGADRALIGAARHSAGRTAGILGCTLAGAAAALAEPAVLGHTLDLLLRGDPAGPTWTLLCAAVITADVLLDAAAARLTGEVDGRSTARLRRLALGRLLGTFPHLAARDAPGDTAARLTAHATEAGKAPAAAAHAVAALLPPVGAIAALLLIDVWTALAFLLGLPLLALLLRAFARDTLASVARYQQVQLETAGRLAEAMAGARTIAAAGTAGRERARILAGLPELGTEGRRMWRVYGGTTARSATLMPLILYTVLAVGGLRLSAGALGVGDLLAALRYATLAAGVGAVPAALAAVVRGRAAARRTAHLLTLTPRGHGPATLPADGPGTLELRNVSVVRGGSTVLHDLSLVIPGGATVAVVGRSGAGKTLFAAVAGRLTDPDEGEVLLDGVPLGELGPGELRREAGYAFDRPALIGDTVADAIGFGDGPAPGPEAVRAAARAAGADLFVSRLPHGYATRLADAPLSGGEVQRLGLARAFCHAGRLLILDDATSSLDTVTARQVERALAHEVRPGTRIVVAHRLSSAARSDLVVWLDHGRVRAVGTHERLWSRHEGYREVFASGTPAEPAPGEPTTPEPTRAEPAPAPRPPAGKEPVR
ncbi:ABC transporter ATP-binding protein, partial [Streptomyces sp. NPDC047014]|uniref:ABC transporter ATP-binding protein n=1 Tax=Streptomyces sp. NPDC047014 TaxID=3155736 RepID=UPI0033FC39B6